VPANKAHATANLALTETTPDGFKSSAGAAAGQNPACQKQRLPPPAKTTFSKCMVLAPKIEDVACRAGLHCRSSGRNAT
jgi:hypothetical protein